MTTAYKYKLWCTTDNSWEITDYKTSVPTVCPTNADHTIDVNSIVILSELSENTVKIKEETTPTGGIVKIEGINFDITAIDGDTQQCDKIFEYPISILSYTFHNTLDNIGDYIDALIMPNTIIGYITSNVSIGDTIINVSSTVIDKIKLGYLVHLYDGITTDDLSYVKSINTSNNTITVKNASTRAYDISTPTYIQISIELMKNYYINQQAIILFGDDKIGGSYLSEGIMIRFLYTNNSSVSKKFTSHVEYMF
jgi:hypothetical protein